MFSDDDQGLEVYEYVADAAADLDVWYAHDGAQGAAPRRGPAAVELDGHPTDVRLGPGDCLVHAGRIPHRWQVDGDAPVRLFLVVLRDPA